MPVASGSGAGGGGRGKRPPRQPIVIHNPATGQTQTVNPVTPSQPVRSTPPKTPAPAVGQGGRGGSSTSSKGGDKTPSNPYLAAQNKAKRAAGDRYMTDAANMQGQIDALRDALGPKGEFRDALRRRLKNITLVTGEQLGVLDDVYNARAGSLDEDMRGNEIAAADTTTGNDTNRARERASAIAEIAAQGAGESAGLQAQLMSLRNWDANQGEAQRAFHDSQRSINAARLDLQADTHTAKANALSEANADREQLWNEYYAQSAESLTQLGNALGQQAEYYGLAHEQGSKLGGRLPGTGGRGGKKGGKKGGRPGKVGDWGTMGADNDYESASDGESLTPWTGPSRRPTADSLDGPRQPGGGMQAFDLGGKGGKGGKGGGRGRGRIKGNLQEQAAAMSDQAFMDASNWMGKAWKNPGIGELGTFKPEVPEEKVLASSLLQNARTTLAQKAPEGATLRKW